MHLILLETSDIQSYLFATNRLRENVGASRLTYRACTQFVLEAVKHLGGPNLWSNDREKLRENLATKQPSPNIPIEIIIATAGKALLLVKDKKVAQTIVSEVTERALREAPGLDICGVISEPFDWDTDKIHLQVKKLHDSFQEIRSSRPYPSARFPSLPIATLCANSGLPAQGVDKDGTEISAISHFKQIATSDYHAQQFSNLSWIAIVHAKVNGIDQIFLEFDKHIGAGYNRNYLNKLRLFSLTLEKAIEKALIEAINRLSKPIIPLILGNTELCLICDGQIALELTYLFLKAFETSYEGIPLSACAGVAIAQPHFPLINTYTLAEELTEKTQILNKRIIGQSCSAMDFHIISNTSFTEISEIRQQLTIHQNTRLTAKPYIVTADNKHRWAKQHHIDGLLSRIRAILKRDDYGRHLLPSSQLHQLREGLLMGRDEADGRLKLILTTNPGFRTLLEQPSKSIFRLAEDGNWETRFLDALEAAPFWKNHENA
ncbi:MAG: hypothetical protein ABFS56_19260 [Pseudomonadota bacterium]